MIFSYPQRDILEYCRPLNLFMGGYGSGKTHMLGVIAYTFAVKFPEVRGIIGANTYNQLSQSTMRQVFKVWKTFGITEYTEANPNGMYVVNKIPPKHFKNFGDVYLKYDGILTFINGHTIYLVTLENADAQQGKEVGYCLLDETRDTREYDVKDTMLSRLRQLGITINGKNVNPLYAFTSPAKVDWINKWFTLDKMTEQINAKIYSDTTYFHHVDSMINVVISSTYHNKHNLPEDYFDRLRFSNTSERYDSIIYANPFGRVGGEYYGSFERKKHVGKAEYDPTLPIHLSFDFNYVPYNPAGLYQIKFVDGMYYVYMIDEFALTSPHNSTEHVCEAILARYGNHKAGWLIYGDATGKAGTITGREQRSNWDTVWFMFKSRTVHKSNRVPRSNPTNTTRRDFMNLIFEEKKPIRFIVDERCTHMINDLMYCKEDADGGKDKKTVKDEAGNSYQPYGHFGDLCEYMFCEAFNKFFIK